MIRNAENNLLSPFMIGLSDLIEKQPKSGYWLRPCNDLQSQQMVAGYLKALQPHLKNGGYIFVKGSRAADLFRQLTELRAAYKAVHFEVIEDIAGIIDIIDPKELWVIVENDSLPYATQASRFHVAEVALRNKMAPPLGTPFNFDDIDKRQTRGMILMMFIEMDYPSVRGFSVVLSQSRSLNIAACRISLDNTHDHELNKLLGEPEHNADELKARRVNTLRIFGSGPKHHAELMMDFHNYALEAPDEAKDMHSNDERASFPETFIAKDRLKKESNLGLAMGNDRAYLVDLSR